MVKAIKYGPEIRIFPNSTKLEHDTEPSRLTYIAEDLRVRGFPRGRPGQYWLRSLKQTRRISVGTVALFRFSSDHIIGEGVISSESKEEYFKDENDEEYRMAPEDVCKQHESRKGEREMKEIEEVRSNGNYL